MPASIFQQANRTLGAKSWSTPLNHTTLESHRPLVPDKIPEGPPTDLVRTSSRGVFEAFSGAIVSTIEEFLRLVPTVIPRSTASCTEECFTRFLLAADAFSSQCSVAFATIVCRSSDRLEIRESKEALVARLVRVRCFEPLDSVLVDYVRILEQLGTNLGKLATQLSESRIRDSLNDGEYARARRGWKARGKTFLVQDLKASALLKMLEYLKRTEFLAQELLDYGALKLFGGEVDFVAQKTCLKFTKERIQDKLKEAVAIVKGLGLVKRRIWEEEHEAETAAIEAVEAAVLSSAQKHVRKKWLMSSLLCVAVCGLPVWFISREDTANIDVLARDFLTMCAVVVFSYWGIAKLASGTVGSKLRMRHSHLS
jgi:hypothetical protein